MNNYTSLLLDLDKDIHLWNDWMAFALKCGGLDKAPVCHQCKNGAYFQELIGFGIIVNYKFLPLLDIFDVVSKMDKYKRTFVLETIASGLSEVYVINGLCHE